MNSDQLLGGALVLLGGFALIGALKLADIAVSVWRRWRNRR